MEPPQQNDPNKSNISAEMAALEDKAKQTFWGKLGCELLHTDEKTAIIALTAGKEHQNLLGIVHGGVYMSLMDNAMGLVVMSNQQNERTVTAAMNTHFLSSSSGGRLECSASMIHQTRRSVTLQAEVTDESGKLLAWASGLYRKI